ncbi:MAG: ribonuclease E/G, partial [Nocardioidaceae bacterium]|nr:ribonuclease E/G [Nocardioidaceae bacterium]
KATAKKATAKKATGELAADDPGTSPDSAAVTESTTSPAEQLGATAAAPAETAEKTAVKRPARRTAKKLAVAAGDPGGAEADTDPGTAASSAGSATPPAATALMFQPPDPAKARPARRTRKTAPVAAAAPSVEEPVEESGQEPGQEPDEQPDDGPADASDVDGVDDGDDSPDGSQSAGSRRRRRRGGRRRRKSGSGEDSTNDADEADESSTDSAEESPAVSSKAKKSGADSRTDEADSGGESSSSRRRRRRRRPGEDGDGGADDPENTVTRVRKERNPEDEITALHGSTRLEAKKQRRREGREAGRRRAPIVSEAEFLARREAVERVMVVRQRADLTQIAVLEDKVLVEHYVARESQTSLIGNVYLGRVQNVLPSMEAAFIDIGKGRNAVLYAGEVNWGSFGAGNGPRKIEQVLKSGQAVLVQVSKAPIGQKGARLTSQISLPGRFLVYVPDGTTSGISRKLPDTERNRLKNLLKEIVPESAGVIVRTAAEGASEDELVLDVERLTARWEDISGRVEKGTAPQLLYGEPDLTLKVVRDLFTEDFGKLVVSGDDAWDMVETYVQHIAPDLSERLERYDGADDVFAAYRIDEQIAKALDRKVWLPSGGSLIIDRTEAMTVVDVNTGKFTGSGGNLEETVTKNNLEAAEEMVRQLRLRDIGGIIVIDFIDMVLESNRDLVLRRMVECLGRDRTRHQVAEVTSLGLVQMTRKRIGTGLLEAFSETCEHCQGRGLSVHLEPVQARTQPDEEPRRGRRSRGRGRSDDEGVTVIASSNGAPAPTPRDVAAMSRPPVEGRDSSRSDEPVETQIPEQTAQQTAQQSPSGPPDTAPAAEQQAAADEPQHVAGTVEASAPAGPRVVTSTRRRVARRPAGPPAGAASPVSVESPQVGVPVESRSSDVPRDDAATGSTIAIHVPVKKKGTRKR